MGKIIHNGITYANVNYEIGPGTYPVQNIDLIPVKPTDNTNIICSGSYSSGTAGYRAFDGDVNTSWASQSSTAAGARYVGYKFSNPVLCNKYTIAYNNSGSYFLDQYPNSYIIQGSNDNGATWADIYEDVWVLTSDPHAVVYRTRTFENDTAYKWYRFLINKAGSSGSNYCVITEITLYQAIYGYLDTLITKSITTNGTYNAFDDNVRGYSSVTVNVPIPSTNFKISDINYTMEITRL